MTPLHYATTKGFFEICSLILENIEDKNPKADRDWTPLHLAARYGQLEICKLIMKYITTRILQMWPMLHLFIWQQCLDIWQFVNSSLKTQMKKILRTILEQHLFTWLLLKKML